MTAKPLAYKRHILWDHIEDGQPYEPFAWQVQHIHNAIEAGQQFVMIAAGRRAGKSTAMKAEIVREAVRPADTVLGIEHSPIIYVVGPTAELANRVFEPVWDMFVPDERGFYQPPLGDFYLTHDKNRGLIVLRNGARIYKKTGDDPRSLQGERVTLAIVDEAHEMNEDAWKALVPSLIDSHGKLICIGIPWGRGRFKTMYTLGQHEEPGYYAASVPTTANPTITEQMLKQLTASMTEAEIAAYIYAEWIDEYGVVFKDPERIFKFTAEKPPQQLHGPYFMGLDVAKMTDYTVAYIIDAHTMQIVDRDRFNKLDYPAAANRIANLYRRWRCLDILTDATGVGEPMHDLLVNEGCSVTQFNFNVSSKQALISGLIRAIEHDWVRVLGSDPTLMAELKLFEGRIVSNASGTRVEYAAPPGAHDDCVMALALAVKAAVPHYEARISNRKVNGGSYVSFGKKKKKLMGVQ